MMRALVLEDFRRMAVAEVPDPEPGPGEVKIEVVATGICGSDIHGYTGENGRRQPGQIMGHESVGRIAEIAGDVADGTLTVGQVVTFNPVVIPEEDLDAYRGREQHDPARRVIGVEAATPAAFAEFVVVPARNVVPLPPELPIAYGALIEPLAVAVHAVRRVGITARQKVLVIGGGPIGQSVVLALLMVGVTRIIVSELDPARRAVIAKLGATPVDPSEESVQETVHRLFGELADATVDAVGTSRTVADALSGTAFGGAVCLVGMGAPKLDLPAFRISTEERTLVGSFTYSTQDFRDAADWMASAPAVVAALISREVPLDRAPDAFASLARGDGTAGKVLVRFDRENKNV